MKTLLIAGTTSLIELKYLLSKQIFIIKDFIFTIYNVLIKNKVKILNSRSQSAEVCKLNFNKPFKKLNGTRLFSSTASQRLHAKDMAWLVGFVEGDGWFSISKNGNYCKYEFGIEISKRDIQLLYKIKDILGVGNIIIRKTRDTVIFRITSKIHLKNITSRRAGTPSGGAGSYF